MQVDDRAHKAYNNMVVKRDYQAMARVAEKFLCRWSDNWVIENIFSDLAEEIGISRTEVFDFEHLLPAG